MPRDLHGQDPVLGFRHGNDPVTGSTQVEESLAERAGRTLRRLAREHEIPDDELAEILAMVGCPLDEEKAA